MCKGLLPTFLWLFVVSFKITLTYLICKTNMIFFNLLCFSTLSVCIRPLIKMTVDFSVQWSFYHQMKTMFQRFTIGNTVSRFLNHFHSIFNQQEFFLILVGLNLVNSRSRSQLRLQQLAKQTFYKQTDREEPASSKPTLIYWTVVSKVLPKFGELESIE